MVLVRYLADRMVSTMALFQVEVSKISTMQDHFFLWNGTSGQIINSVERDPASTTKLAAVCSSIYDIPSEQHLKSHIKHQ